MMMGFDPMKGIDPAQAAGGMAQRRQQMLAQLLGQGPQPAAQGSGGMGGINPMMLMQLLNRQPAATGPAGMYSGGTATNPLTGMRVGGV